MKTALIAALCALSIARAQAVALANARPTGVVRYDDLDLRKAHDADVLRRRVDRTIISLGGGDNIQTDTVFERPDIEAARAKGRRQANELICAARSTKKKRAS